MITEILIPELVKRFPNLAFEQGTSPDVIVTIRAAHPPLGDVFIYDYGGEAAVEIKNFTHSHFDRYEPDLSPEARERLIVEEIIDFLADLFNDQIIFWVRSDGSAGGWKRLEYLNDPAMPTSPFEEGPYYAWSGLVDPDKLRPSQHS